MSSSGQRAAELNRTDEMMHTHNSGGAGLRARPNDLSYSEIKRLYKVPNSNTLICRVVLEILAVLVLAYPMFHIYVILRGDAEPYLRGFFCDDENLKHPFLKEEITVGECVIIWTAVVVFFVSLVELLHFSVFKYRGWESQMMVGCDNDDSGGGRQGRANFLAKIPWVFIELYRVFGYFALGALATLLMTEMAKYKIGRLRPYFLTACRPRLTPDLCLDEFGYQRFVVDYVCFGDPEEVREARKSFMSGHSSFSFYCAVFLVLYLHARLEAGSSKDSEKVSGRRWLRMTLRAIKTLRPFLQFAIFSLAFYIAWTRISDYRHHPTDVLAGAALGTAFALLNMSFLINLFRKPRSFRNIEHDRDFVSGGDVEAVVVNCMEAYSRQISMNSSGVAAPGDPFRSGTLLTETTSARFPTAGRIAGNNPPCRLPPHPQQARSPVSR